MGFGNLRFAEIKSCPSTYPTCDLRKVEICNKNFWIGNDPPPFGTFPKIHPFWWGDASLISAIKNRRLYVLSKAGDQLLVGDH